ncbi:MAG: tyrosine-type recombinase/integrase [Sciscionella sp.]
MNYDTMLTDYLAVRRALGAKLERPEKLLRQFLAFLDERGQEQITLEAMIEWVRLPAADARVSPGWLGMRMNAVRGFAEFCRSLDKTTPVPPKGLLSDGGKRATPYLYAAAEIDALCHAALTLRGPVRQATYRTLIRLLAATGMRIGEAAGLDVADFEPGEGLLLVREAKFDRHRLLPLHPSTTAALREYRRQIEMALPDLRTAALLVSGHGTRLLTVNIGATFRQLVTLAGLAPRSSTCRPRPHDLRHSFAVRTLIDWYRDGQPVEPRLPLLSTYLGHTCPAHTYWYLHAAPELMARAAARLTSYQDRAQP